VTCFSCIENSQKWENMNKIRNTIWNTEICTIGLFLEKKFIHTLLFCFFNFCLLIYLFLFFYLLLVVGFLLFIFYFFVFSLFFRFLFIYTYIIELKSTPITTSSNVLFPPLNLYRLLSKIVEIPKVSTISKLQKKLE
jgi:hypothetical protein